MITQENASSSDELTQSSNQLSVLATNLNRAVGFFKIDESDLDLKVADMPEIEEEEEKNVEEVLKEDTDKPERELNEEPKSSPITNLGKEFDLDNYEKF
jgi:methyl-accepting chemotaxis protein